MTAAMRAAAAGLTNKNLTASSKNPTLSRIGAEQKSPEFAEGEHWRIVCREGGAERRDLPIFTNFPNAIKFENEEARGKMSREDVQGVEGGFIVHNVLSRDECDQLVKMSETMGYTEDAPVSLGRHIRQNENCVWVADPSVNDTIFERLKPFLPQEVTGGEPCGMNARWRLYKYNPQDIFKMHTDGSWPGSGLDDQGRLVRDMYGDRWSQLTVVFYLNNEFEAGETRFFFPLDRTGSQHRIEKAKPDVGGALCFFHGEHPLSPLHEGGFVNQGTKYIIRSDLLYKLPPKGQGTYQEGWQRHYQQQPPLGLPSRAALREVLKSATPAQREEVVRMLQHLGAIDQDQENGDD